jgi:hypothetical protein
MQVTRRNLVQLAAAAASGILGTKMSGLAVATAQKASVSSAEPPIERLTVRRRGVGLRGYDRERAFAGFTLFSPLSSSNKTAPSFGNTSIPTLARASSS